MICWLVLKPVSDLWPDVVIWFYESNIPRGNINHGRVIPLFVSSVCGPSSCSSLSMLRCSSLSMLRCPTHHCAVLQRDLAFAVHMHILSALWIDTAHVNWLIKIPTWGLGCNGVNPRGDSIGMSPVYSLCSFTDKSDSGMCCPVSALVLLMNRPQWCSGYVIS